MKRDEKGYARLIATTAKELGLPKTQVARVLRRALEVLRDDVWATGRVLVPELGAFRITKRKARRISNPVTGEPMHLPATESIAFRASKSWRTR